MAGLNLLADGGEPFGQDSYVLEIAKLIPIACTTIGAFSRKAPQFVLDSFDQYDQYGFYFRYKGCLL